MRWLFWLLLLANLIFSSLMQWGEVLTGAGKSLQPQQALNGGKVKLLGVPAPAQIPASSPSVSQAEVQAACMEWGEFSGSDLTRATAALDALKLDGRLTQRQVEHTSGYWVYIPPRQNRAEVDKKVTEIRTLGVEEYFIVQEAGKWHNAISLGVFKTEEAAQKFLEKIKEKGVKSAMVGERVSKIVLTVFVLKNPDTGTTARVVELQNEFAGSELKAVACD